MEETPKPPEEKKGQSQLARLKAQAATETPAKSRSKKPKPVAHTLDETEFLELKMLIWGLTGTGKTFFLVGPLLAGERVMVLSTDFGANGLLTVRNELKRINRADLLKNLKYINLSDYEQIDEFLKNPVSYVPDIMEFSPTLLVWEGFSSYNVDITDEYVLSLAPSMDTEKSNASGGELREEGLLTNQQDWAAIQRATIRGVRQFLAMNFGKPIHKVMTTLEAEPKERKSDGRTVSLPAGPLIKGGGRDFQPPAFDLVIQATKTENFKGEVQYGYKTTGASNRFVLKSRGFALDPEEPGDPQALWKKLKASLE